MKPNSTCKKFDFDEFKALLTKDLESQDIFICNDEAWEIITLEITEMIKTPEALDEVAEYMFSGMTIDEIGIMTEVISFLEPQYVTRKFTEALKWCIYKWYLSMDMPFTDRCFEWWIIDSYDEALEEKGE